MIILDTNIISEMMKSTPDKNVSDWLDQQNASDLVITSITIAEINYGLQVLPQGKRKKQLLECFQQVLQLAFAERILIFDHAAADEYGEIMSYHKSIGRPLSRCDGQIAAIARAHHLAIATRNTKDFTDCSLEIFNPFEFSGRAL